MADDPTKNFSKTANVEQPRNWEQFQADMGTATESFEEAQRKKEQKQKQESESEKDGDRKPRPPEQTHEMPGLGGIAVRSSIAQENAMRRARALEAQKKAEGLEQEAKRKQAGSEVEMKREGAAVSEPSTTNPKAPEKRVLESAGKARDEAKEAKLLARVQRMELAQQGRDLMKSKDEHQK